MKKTQRSNDLGGVGVGEGGDAADGWEEWARELRRTTGKSGVTSHIVWEWGCAYMYKCTLYDTTRFKAVMAMNLSELRS
jgi:hypothetical protein